MRLSVYCHNILKSFNIFENIIKLNLKHLKIVETLKNLKNENFVHVLFDLREVENEVHTCCSQNTHTANVLFPQPCSTPFLTRSRLHHGR